MSRCFKVNLENLDGERNVSQAVPYISVGQKDVASKCRASNDMYSLMTF